MMPHHEIPRRSSQGPAPLSFAQELLWLMDRAQPGLAAWNVPRALRLRGALDVDALQHALDAFVARHEAMRTVFTSVGGDPRQIIQSPRSVHITRADVSGESDAAAAVARLAREHALRPFDLASDLLLRAMLIRVTADEHVLCLNTHHIVSDGWSKSIMFRELSAFYRAARRNQAAAITPLPLQFADYATWERDARHESALAEPLAYWREKLAGPLPTLDVPGDLRPGLLPTFEGARRVAILPASLVARARELASAHDATLYMVLLATYVAMLHRYSGQDDIIVGSPIVGRTQPETEDLIGYFANTLVLRTRLEGDPTFSELLGRVRDTAFGAFENQDVPFEKLVLELQRGQHLSHAPLFQAVLTMEDTVPGALEFDGLTVEAMPLTEGATKFALTMLVAEQPDGLRLALWYRTDLFAPATVDRMLTSFQLLLEAAIANPNERVSDARVVSPTQRAELMSLGTGEAHAHHATVLERFDTAVARSPNAVAVRCGAVALSYSDVARRARDIAARLHSEGVRPGDTVAVIVDRSTELLVAVLGAWYAGTAYLPIATDTPAARVANYVESAGARAAIVATHTPITLPTACIPVDGELAPGAPVAFANHQVDADRAAYVLFTSGSTGAPKGVRVTHRNLAHYVDAIVERLEISPAEAITFASVSPLGADLGNTSIFPAIATGGVIDFVPDDVARDPALFGSYVAEHHVDVLKITPGHLHALSAARSSSELRAMLPARWLVAGGEALAWDVAARVVEAGKCRVLNHYGPTEATVGACAFEVTEAVIRELRDRTPSVPIGTPLAGARCYVLDRKRRLVPRGVVGELFIGGDGVADGYVGRDDLTVERFVADPFRSDGDARMYVTGDRVRWLGAVNALEFVGRADDQIKVRGFRVELAEVEHVLSSHPSVAACVVVGVSSANGGPTIDRLVAFVVSARSTGYAAAHASARTGTAPDDLSAWLRDRLPDYMVPERIVFRDELPLGASRKVDRRALAALAVESANDAPVDVHEEPATETERAIARIWQDVLQRERVGVADNFLELGGHSLLAIRVLGRLSKQFGVRLPLRTLFESPTIRSLAQVVDAELAEIERRELESVLASLDGAEHGTASADRKEHKTT